MAPFIRMAIFITVMDQITKLIVVHAMNLKELRVILIYEPFILFRMAWNDGINFGIPLGSRWVLIALALAICAWIIWWMNRDRPNIWVQISAGLVVGGAVGNVIELRLSRRLSSATNRGSLIPGGQKRVGVITRAAVGHRRANGDVRRQVLVLGSQPVRDPRTHGRTN